MSSFIFPNRHFLFFKKMDHVQENYSRWSAYEVFRKDSKTNEAGGGSEPLFLATQPAQSLFLSRPMLGVVFRRFELGLRRFYTTQNWDEESV